MLKSRRHWPFLMIGLFLTGGAFLAPSTEVEARPQYFPQFTKKYPDVKEASKQKCNVCHYATDKKKRNNYGSDFADELGAKNEKDKTKIDKALEKIESEKSAVEGKTYKDLLKDGKLPASGWEQPK